MTIFPFNFHFQRFEFVLFQLWFIVLTVLVCFCSNQCTVTIPECNAMYALQTSLNLPTSITNHGNNQTNPCSKKKKQNDLSNLLFAWFLNYDSKKKKCLNNSLARSELHFFLISNNPNQLELAGTQRNYSQWSWKFNFPDIFVRKLEEKMNHPLNYFILWPFFFLFDLFFLSF